MLPLLLALLLSGCAEEEPDILEKIAAAPIARMECAEDEEGYLLDTVELQSLAAMDIRATEGSFTGDWVYCFTFYPREVCPNEREIPVLFGEKSLCIDGTLYVPADGGSYASILEWVKNKYEYFILILNKTFRFIKKTPPNGVVDSIIFEKENNGISSHTVLDVPSAL